MYMCDVLCLHDWNRPDLTSPSLSSNWAEVAGLVCICAGKPRLCRGHRLVDAAIFEPVPLRTALRDGCSHVMVLCTRPATLHTSWRKVVRGTVVRVMKRTVLNAPYMRAAWASRNSSQHAEQVRSMFLL